MGVLDIMVISSVFVGLRDAFIHIPLGCFSVSACKVMLNDMGKSTAHKPQQNKAKCQTWSYFWGCIVIFQKTLNALQNTNGRSETRNVGLAQYLFKTPLNVYDNLALNSVI